MKANKFLMLKCELPFPGSLSSHTPQTLLPICLLERHKYFYFSYRWKFFYLYIFPSHLFPYSVLHFIYTEALVPETESIFIFTDYKGTMFVDTARQLHTWTHRGRDSMQRTCVSLNQIKCQHVKLKDPSLAKELLENSLLLGEKWPVFSENVAPVKLAMM